MDALVGKTVAHYRIVEKIDEGGMGQVFRARDLRLDRDVAIKVLPEAFSSDPDRLARFEREAKILASLNHPNVAAIYGLEEVDGRAFLILELVEGETLESRIARGRLALADAVLICRQVAAGIEAAHEAGVVHRDLKPANVMVTSGDVVKVVDFGIAKGRVAEPDAISQESPTVTDSPALRHSPTIGTPATLPGVILGTAAYLSPEQARGKVVDRRTDIWSFGCVLYECLAGRPAFRGDTVTDLIAAILAREPDWGDLPKGTPPMLRELVARCLDKDPRRRLRDIGEARLALEGIGIRKVSAWGRPKGHLRPLLGAAVVILIAALGIWLWNEAGRRWGRAPSQSTVPITPTPGTASPASSAPSIAVLPFEDLSPGRDQEYFADGMSEELINALSGVAGLRVISRTSSFSFKGQDVDLATIAKKLGVGMILEGSVRKAGDQLRITADLVQVATDSQIWSQAYDRKFADIFAIQEDISKSVVDQIRLALPGGNLDPGTVTAARAEIAGVSWGGWTSPEAYRLALLAVHFRRLHTREGNLKALEYWERIAKLEDGTALGWGVRYAIYMSEADLGLRPQDEAERLGLDAATRAVALAPEEPGAHETLAVLRWNTFDLAGADRAVRRAMKLSSGRDAGLLRIAAIIYGALGRLGEAIDLSRRSLDADPLSPATYQNLGGYLADADSLAEAEKMDRKALELAPLGGQVRGHLAMTLLRQGRVHEALEEARREPSEDWRLPALAIASYKAGDVASSDSALTALIRHHADADAYQIAEVYAYRGESDEAFRWLERAWKQRDGGLLGSRNDWLMRGLHGDLRWEPFLRKIKLSS